MGTIFDHNPTNDELIALTGSVISRQEYYSIPRDQQTEFGRIYSLYSIRNDVATAATYLARIDDPLHRYNLSTSDLLSSRHHWVCPDLRFEAPCC